MTIVFTMKISKMDYFYFIYTCVFVKELCGQDQNNTCTVNHTLFFNSHN